MEERERNGRETERREGREGLQEKIRKDDSRVKQGETKQGKVLN